MHACMHACTDALYYIILYLNEVWWFCVHRYSLLVLIWYSAIFLYCLLSFLPVVICINTYFAFSFSFLFHFFVLCCYNFPLLFTFLLFLLFLFILLPINQCSSLPRKLATLALCISPLDSYIPYASTSASPTSFFPHGLAILSFSWCCRRLFTMPSWISKKIKY